MKKLVIVFYLSIILTFMVSCGSHNIIDNSSQSIASSEQDIGNETSDDSLNSIESDPVSEVSYIEVICIENASDYEYTDNGDGTASITAYNGSDKKIKIPSDIDGKKVTSIADSVFYGSEITHVIIPEGIISLGSEVFYECQKLEYVSLPESLVNMGDKSGCFGKCVSLKEIIIPDGVKEIVKESFYGCTSLEKVILPEYLTSIGVWAFFKCKSLCSIEIPDSVTSINRAAFGCCDCLSDVSLPDNITSFGPGAFDNNVAVITEESETEKAALIGGDFTFKSKTK